MLAQLQSLQTAVKQNPNNQALESQMRQYKVQDLFLCEVGNFQNLRRASPR